jgi:hypothetical protein
MAVYREGFAAIDIIEKASVQIYNDACDFGAPCKKGDKIWNTAKQLVDWYKVENSRKQYNIGNKPYGVENVVELMDEWALGDRRKTVEEATEYYKVSYHKMSKGVDGAYRSYDGFISIEKIS